MRNRTADLYNAIVALYQLSYDPEPFGRARHAALDWVGETIARPIPAQGKNASAWKRALSFFLFIDILDDFGHVVLVLAEFRGILDQVLVLFFSGDAGD